MIRFARTLQRHWDWRAAGNFVFGGTGGMLLALAPFAGSDTAAMLATLAALALVGTGLLCVWLEIGRPWRALNVFRHPQRSWMTREAFVATVAFVLALSGLVLRSPALSWIAAAFGVAFVYCQGRILMASRGVPSWRPKEVVPLVLSTGLSEGSAVLVAALVLQADGVPTWLAWLLAAAVLARAFAWARYRAALVRDDAPAAAIALMQRMHPWLLAGGTAVPLVSVVGALFAPADVAPPAAFFGAICALLAGWWFKFVLVTRASQLQGYAFGKLRSGHPLARSRTAKQGRPGAAGFPEVLPGDNR